MDRTNKILLINVRGLKSTLEQTKKRQAFMAMIEYYSVICLTETKETGNEPDPIPGFQLVASRPAQKTGGSPSGGLALYAKPNKNVSNMNITKSKYLLVVETLGTAICLVYFPPANSNTYKPNDNPFAVLNDVVEILEEKFQSKYVILGDFNSHTGSSVHMNELSQVDMARTSEDFTVDQFGIYLIELCRKKNLLILNGRCSGDRDGSVTYRCTPTSAGGTVLDYAIVPRSTYDRFDLQVLTLASGFDHMPISVTIKEPSSKRAKTCNIGHLSKEFARTNIASNQETVRVLLWNICGLKDTLKEIEKRKIFEETIHEYDVICLVETWWGGQKPPRIPNFNDVANRNGSKFGQKQGRLSGGIAVYAKNDTSNRMRVDDKDHSSFILWCVLYDRYCLGVCYTPPITSSTYSYNPDPYTKIGESVKRIQNSYRKAIALLGDFNAKTGSPQQMNEEEEDQLRISKDYNVNEFGLKFVKLCRENGLKILNGRDDDKPGEYTHYHDKQIGTSVVDYCALSRTQTRYEFRVVPIQGKSFDHCPIEVILPRGNSTI